MFCVFRGNGLVWFAAAVSGDTAESFIFSVKEKKKENKNESPFPVKRDTTPGLGD